MFLKEFYFVLCDGFEMTVWGRWGKRRVDQFIKLWADWIVKVISIISLFLKVQPLRETYIGIDQTST